MQLHWSALWAAAAIAGSHKHTHVAKQEALAFIIFLFPVCLYTYYNLQECLRKHPSPHLSQSLFQWQCYTDNFWYITWISKDHSSHFSGQWRTSAARWCKAAALCEPLKRKEGWVKGKRFFQWLTEPPLPAWDLLFQSDNRVSACFSGNERTPCCVPSSIQRDSFSILPICLLQETPVSYVTDAVAGSKGDDR